LPDGLYVNNHSGKNHVTGFPDRPFDDSLNNLLCPVTPWSIGYVMPQELSVLRKLPCWPFFEESIQD
jgi:hypothetical protein